MRTLVQLNRLVLKKYKSDAKTTWWSYAICLLVQYTILDKGIISDEEHDLWYNNFLKYKPKEIKDLKTAWWDMGNPKDDINKRIRVLETILKDSIEEAKK